MAQLAFGDPGFFDFLGQAGQAIASGFKAAAPIISTAASFIPIVGPIASRAVNAVAGLIPDENSDTSPSRADGDDDSDE